MDLGDCLQMIEAIRHFRGHVGRLHGIVTVASPAKQERLPTQINPGITLPETLIVLSSVLLTWTRFHSRDRAVPTPCPPDLTVEAERPSSPLICIDLCNLKVFLF